jgi:hypothetical protein
MVYDFDFSFDDTIPWRDADIALSNPTGLAHTLSYRSLSRVLSGAPDEDEACPSSLAIIACIIKAKFLILFFRAARSRLMVEIESRRSPQAGTVPQFTASPAWSGSFRSRPSKTPVPNL